jgi:3',5'-cyclic AMP phosphodiesterase CpdA
MRVLHFSDIHLDFSLRRVPLRDWLGKRVIGGGNYLLRRRPFFRDALPRIERLAEQLPEMGVDLVLFSGDFTTLGTRGELEAARVAIAPFLDAPEGFVCVPGNHDLYLRDTVVQRRFEDSFGDLLGSDLPELASDGPWPLVRLLDGVAVVALNSARPNPQPWRSSGWISPAQLEGLERALRHPELENRFVFVVTHYAPCLEDGSPDTPQHGLVNADALLLAIEPMGERGALLCGHVHHAYTVRPREKGPRIFCAGSATLRGREGLWLFDVEPGHRVRYCRGRWHEDGSSWSLDPPEHWTPHDS